MATKRLFSRADEFTVGMQPVARSAELFDSITLPLRLPFEHALAMLEVRQILRQPGKHQDQLKEIIKALGISGSCQTREKVDSSLSLLLSGFRPSSLINSFFDITSATQPKSRRLHSIQNEIHSLLFFINRFS